MEKEMPLEQGKALLGDGGVPAGPRRQISEVVKKGEQQYDRAIGADQI
jgi:hypothetical protein